MSDDSPVPWHRIFCERPVEMAALQAAYEAVADPIAPKPQIVALVAESGLGKTRLIQEFYHWLSIVKDGVAGAGYWPDDLERLGDTLQIVPRSGFIPENEMQFIWAGTRLPNPGERNSAPSSKIDSLAADFVPHVQDLYKRRHREKKMREINEAGREAAKEMGLKQRKKLPKRLLISSFRSRVSSYLSHPRPQWSTNLAKS